MGATKTGKKQAISVTCKAADLLPFDQLLDFQGNLKTISGKNLEKLKSRILKHGINAPVFVWKNNGRHFILDGHQRIKAFQALEEEGFELPEIPVAYIEAKNIKDAKDKLLGISSQYGRFDSEGMATFVTDLELLDDIHLVDTKLSIGSLFKRDTVGDDAVPKPGKTVTKKNDLWQLGKHRLLCADSTKKESIDKLLGGKKAHLVFTDPPYNIGLKRRSSRKQFQSEESSKTALNQNLYEWNDNLNDKEQESFCRKIIEHIAYTLLPGGRFYLWSARITQFDAFRKATRNNADLHYSDLIIWKKDVPVLTRKEYLQGYEVCHYGWKKPSPRELFMDLGSDRDVWEANKVPDSKMQHLTEKPVALAERAIRNHSRAGSVVADFFLGSGSTVIACEKLNRVCYGVELDPRYCDVAVKRYATWCRKNKRPFKLKRNGEEIDPEIFAEKS
jgi:DNA modification methylase